MKRPAIIDIRGE